MLIWIVFCLMAFAAIIAVLWPLSRPAAPAQPSDEADVAFYKGQLDEIERDRARGMLTPDEAEAAKIEAGRRLLQAARGADGAAPSSFHGTPALWRRRIVAVLIVLLVPVCALAVYMHNGVPDYADRSDKQKVYERQLKEIDQEIAKLEQYLQKNPKDGSSWERIAYIYLRMGRADNAVAAYEKANSILGENSDRLTGYGEALLDVANRVQDQKVAEATFAKAKTSFEKAALDPGAARARAYLGAAAQEAGDIEKAKEYYRAALKINPEWSDVRRRLSALETPQGSSSGSGDNQPQLGQAEIGAMVENLAARLDQQGGSAKEWSQLMRSYVVLKQKDKAIAVLGKARKALAGKSDELAAFNSVAGELGLEEGK